jgi:hypothetical protein
MIKVRPKLEKIISQSQTFLNKQQNWNISGGRLQTKKAGYYPIFEYIDPTILNLGGTVVTKLEAAFNGRDYIITKDQLRTSEQLNEIYQRYYIGDLHPDRFYFVDGIKTFNFNYTYQIGSSPEDINNILDTYATNLPPYLKELKQYWQPDETS